MFNIFSSQMSGTVWTRKLCWRDGTRWNDHKNSTINSIIQVECSIHFAHKCLEQIEPGISVEQTELNSRKQSQEFKLSTQLYKFNWMNLATPEGTRDIKMNAARNTKSNTCINVQYCFQNETYVNMPNIFSKPSHVHRDWLSSQILAAAVEF